MMGILIVALFVVITLEVILIAIYNRTENLNLQIVINSLDDFIMLVILSLVFLIVIVGCL